MDTVLSSDEPSPCPACRQPGGFHDPAIHNAHEVPRRLTWKPSEPPPWSWKLATTGTVAEDEESLRKVLRGMSKELLS